MSALPETTTTSWLRPALFAVALVLVVTAFATLPVTDWLIDFVGWLRGVGPVGYLAFALVYVGFTVLAGPASVLTIGAGFAWGPLVAWLLVVPSATIGASAAFLLGRTVLRDRVQHQVDRRPRFAAIDRAVAANGFLLVLLMRLSPVFPFNLMNYSLGLTQVSLKHYAVATFVGIMPGVLLYSWLGSTLTQLSDLASGAPSTGAGGQALYWGGLLATLAVTVLVTRIARNALDSYVEPQD